MSQGFFLTEPGAGLFSNSFYTNSDEIWREIESS